jgi:uncharacterized protein DUF6152
MKHGITASVTLGIMLGAIAMWAHHNNIRFDAENLVTVTGTLSKLDWRNPHIYMYIDAKNDRGQVERWALECQPPNFFAIRKISRADFENNLGKTVTVEVRPARDGSPNGLLLKMTGPDGKVLMAR